MARLKHLPVGKFLRFGIVGLLGLGVDTAVVYSLAPVMNLYFAGLIAFPIAASFNWLVNRLWTYRDRDHSRISVHRQLMLFLMVNTTGFVLNRGTYMALILTSAVCYRYPVLAIGAGAVAGMFTNFVLSHRVVFR